MPGEPSTCQIHRKFKVSTTVTSSNQIHLSIRETSAAGSTILMVKIKHKMDSMER